MNAEETKLPKDIDLIGLLLNEACLERQIFIDDKGNHKLEYIESKVEPNTES